MRNVKKIILIIFIIMGLFIPTNRIQAASSYDQTDVAKVQEMLDNVNFDWTQVWGLSRDNPATWGNKIVVWDRNSNPYKIKEVFVYSKKLTGKLTVPAELTALIDLDCSSNQLSELDIQAPNLKKIECNSNQLTNLTFNGETYPALEELICHNNALGNIDLSKFTGLTYLVCSNNNITDLNLSPVAKTLKKLECGKNPMESIDLSKMEVLTSLSCSGAKIESLDLSYLPQLTYLNCSNNKLTDLDISNNLELTNLQMGNDLLIGENKFTSIDISKHTKLNQFSALDVGLSSITFSPSNIMEHFNVAKNQLEGTLDVSVFPNLKGLYAYSNKLTAIPINGLSKLTEYLVRDNQLTDIDLTTCTSLNLVDSNVAIYNNPLKTFKYNNVDYSFLSNNGNVIITDFNKDTSKISVEAKPNDGYVFDHWEMKPNLLTPEMVNTNKISITHNGQMELHAVMTSSNNLLSSLSYQFEGETGNHDISLEQNQFHYQVTLPRTVAPDAKIKLDGVTENALDRKSVV